MAENVILHRWKSLIARCVEMCYRQVAEISYSLVGRNIPSQQCGKDISINVSWSSVRKCVYGNVAKTHLPVLLKSTVG